MATATTPAQRRLAAALQELKGLQVRGISVLRTADISRASREALLEAKYLQPIITGWYMSTAPSARDGDTTPWIAHAREFIQRYAQSHFNDDWCVDPDYSIKLQTGSTLIPAQVVIHAPGGNNNRQDLPFGSSMYVYKLREALPAEHVQVVQGIRVYSLPYALTKVAEVFFRSSQPDAMLALRSLPDATDLNRILLESGQPAAAGRLAGALRACGRDELADDILAAMRAVGHRVTEENPFRGPLVQLGSARPRSPYVDRIDMMWALMREEVIANFQAANARPLPATRAQVDATMHAIEALYVTDAYHSLSIEGYRVTEDLIRKVATGQWNPDGHEDDRGQRDAMAAYGYWKAHNAVKETIRRALEDPRAMSIGDRVRREHSTWYREMFSPSVDAGILKPADLAGYRNDQVYIKRARHVPPAKEAVRDTMPKLFDLLRDEQNAAVRAVLGHFIFVFIHPYMDGNGRMARFLMNTMLTTAGYPWTVIKLEQRSEYFKALDLASAEGQVAPFAQFISECAAQVKPPEPQTARRAAPAKKSAIRRP
jgi:Fic family protein